MHRFLGLLGLVAIAGAAPGAHAADMAAGKAKAQDCAACHGENGVSVSDDIPNLAGQKAKYVADQLKAFKAGKRRNDIMNAIAAQLGDGDIANLAAFWNSLPGAAGDAKSPMAAAVNATRVTFPGDYQKTFTLFRTRNLEDRKQVRKTYANPAAVQAAREGKPLPSGSYILIEVYKAKLDASGSPVKGGDGFFEPDKLTLYTAMELGEGWGKDIPEIYRNGDWNYAVFKADKSLKGDTNHAKCLACHKPLASDDYVFTLKELKEVAAKN